MAGLKELRPRLTKRQAKAVLARAVLKMEAETGHREYRESLVGVKKLAAKCIVDTNLESSKNHIIRDKQCNVSDGKDKKDTRSVRTRKKEEKTKEATITVIDVPDEIVIPLQSKPGPCPCLNCKHSTHLPGLAIKHQCPQCKKMFRKTSHLREHVVVHREEGEHTCQVCGAAFKRHDQLVRHLYTHDNDQAKQRFRCRNCKQTFSRKDNFKTHIKRKQKCRDFIGGNDTYWGLETLHDRIDKSVVVKNPKKSSFSPTSISQASTGFSISSSDVSNSHISDPNSHLSSPTTPKRGNILIPVSFDENGQMLCDAEHIPSLAKLGWKTNTALIGTTYLATKEAIPVQNKEISNNANLETSTENYTRSVDVAIVDVEPLDEDISCSQLLTPPFTPPPPPKANTPVSPDPLSPVDTTNSSISVKTSIPSTMLTPVKSLSTSDSEDIPNNSVKLNPVKEKHILTSITEPMTGLGVENGSVIPSSSTQQLPPVCVLDTMLPITQQVLLQTGRNVSENNAIFSDETVVLGGEIAPNDHPESSGGIVASSRNLATPHDQNFKATSSKSTESIDYVMSSLSTVGLISSDKIYDPTKDSNSKHMTWNQPAFSNTVALGQPVNSNSSQPETQQQLVYLQLNDILPHNGGNEHNNNNNINTESNARGLNCSQIEEKPKDILSRMIEELISGEETHCDTQDVTQQIINILKAGQACNQSDEMCGSNIQEEETNCGQVKSNNSETNIPENVTNKNINVQEYSPKQVGDLESQNRSTILQFSPKEKVVKIVNSRRKRKAVGSTSSANTFVKRIFKSKKRLLSEYEPENDNILSSLSKSEPERIETNETYINIDTEAEIDETKCTDKFTRSEDYISVIDEDHNLEQSINVESGKIRISSMHDTQDSSSREALPYSLELQQPLQLVSPRCTAPILQSPKQNSHSNRFSPSLLCVSPGSRQSPGLLFTSSPGRLLNSSPFHKSPGLFSLSPGPASPLIMSRRSPTLPMSRTPDINQLGFGTFTYEQESDQLLDDRYLSELEHRFKGDFCSPGGGFLFQSG